MTTTYHYLREVLAELEKSDGPATIDRIKLMESIAHAFKVIDDLAAASPRIEIKLKKLDVSEEP